LSESAVQLTGFGLAHSGGDGNVLFEAVDLEIPKGSFVLVVGPSGAGKSTLLHLLCGLREEHEPAPMVEGSVHVLGKNITRGFPDSLRGRVQAVLQDEGLLDELSPRGNVEFGLRAARRSVRLAPALLAQAGLPDPPAEVAALSGGMRKRVAVARALAGEPDLLIYDEPTAGLDPASAAQIATLLRSTHDESKGRGRTTLVITHDLSAFDGLFDLALVLDRGRQDLVLVEPDLMERALGEAEADRPASVRAPDPWMAVRRSLLSTAALVQVVGRAITHAPPRFPGLALGTAARFAMESALFVAVGCATVGGLATFFALRNNPLEGAFLGAVVAGSAKVLVAVLVPLLAGFFFTARIAAGATARLATMKRTRQVDALVLMGQDPADHLLAPLVWGTTLALPLVTAGGVLFATTASLLATQAVTGMPTMAWAEGFRSGITPADLRYGLLKALLSAFLVAVVSHHLAMAPKRSGQDVGHAVNRSIVLGISATLVVHALVTLFQFG
jgi:ABC-type multidrug transport system ATPase subunit/ABC-type transporter Mla maintaining outer membrane lipid asymmetry permease subunit MlaE